MPTRPTIPTAEVDESLRAGPIDWLRALHDMMRAAAGAGTQALPTDARDRRKAEEELERTELKYRRLFDHMPIAFWQIDTSASHNVVRALRAEGMTDFRAHYEAHPEAAFRLLDAMRVTDANEEAVRMLGALDRSDLIGPLSRIWTDLERYVHSVEERRRGAYFSTRTAKIDTFDGRRLDILSCVSGGGAFSDEDISLIGAIDITDRVRAYEELAKSEAKYRTLFDQMPIGVIQTNTRELLREFARLRAEGVNDLDAYMDVHPGFLDEAMRILRIEEANEHAAEVLGATKPSDLVGPVDHTFKADRDAFRRNLIARFSSAEIYSEERRRIRPDGSTADVLYTSTFSPALNEL